MMQIHSCLYSVQLFVLPVATVPLHAVVDVLMHLPPVHFGRQHLIVESPILWKNWTC
jgi:hypothetical protein